MIAESPRVRMSVLGIVVFALFASLFARLYYLQVMATDQYEVAAQANRIRVVPVEAPAAASSTARARSWSTTASRSRSPSTGPSSTSSRTRSARAS